MTRDDLMKLRQEVYTMWYYSKNKEKRKTYKKLLKLIDYTEDLKGSLKSISQIGLSHL
tara:strand:- start:5597 stop:5770 length:174 start_codon:yes stop_codon:yes gene_type:complete